MMYIFDKKNSLVCCFLLNTHLSTFRSPYQYTNIIQSVEGQITSTVPKIATQKAIDMQRSLGADQGIKF